MACCYQTLCKVCLDIKLEENEHGHYDCQYCKYPNANYGINKALLQIIEVKFKDGAIICDQHPDSEVEYYYSGRLVCEQCLNEDEKEVAIQVNRRTIGRYVGESVRKMTELKNRCEKTIETVNFLRYKVAG